MGPGFESLEVHEKQSFLESWGISAVGSAQHWQCWGHEFESRMLHSHRNSTSESNLKCFSISRRLKTGFATINRCRATADVDAGKAERSTRSRAGKEEKICSGYARRVLLLNKAQSGLSPVKFRVLHKIHSENS